MNAPVSPQMHADLSARLRALETEENIRVLFAIESGSRAWGVHSPDSDYDVRFVYTRPVAWHLQVSPGRDVVELPIDDTLDISGWDLRKALGLALRGNAVIAEWLQSPVTYIERPETARLRDFTRQVLRRRPVSWHYLSMLGKHAERAQTSDGVQIKRLFYTLRPALVLRWMRLNNAAFAPMHMQALREGCDLPQALEHEIDDLIARKLRADEAAHLPKAPALILDLIETERALTRDWLSTTPEPRVDPALRAQADALHAALTIDTQKPAAKP